MTQADPNFADANVAVPNTADPQVGVVPYGLTRFDFFAAIALQGLVSADPTLSPKIAASSAVAYATALKLELDKTEGGGLGYG